MDETFNPSGEDCSENAPLSPHDEFLMGEESGILEVSFSVFFVVFRGVLFRFKKLFWNALSHITNRVMTCDVIFRSIRLRGAFERSTIFFAGKVFLLMDSCVLYVGQLDDVSEGKCVRVCIGVYVAR
jgi:hypothetical protein